jgi:hypothetical protein
MTTQSDRRQQLDLRPFQIYAPVPPMLAEACGYTGQVFGLLLDARYVGFYWERSGDEANYDDGKASGTGEYTGFLAFVDHPKVAVHLRHCDFGSSETLPRHYLLLDRTNNFLYALPVSLAQQFLHRQWQKQDQVTEKQPGTEGAMQVNSMEDLIAALNLATWQEVKPTGDINAQVTTAMQRQDQLVSDLVAWLNAQQKPLSPERIAEYEPHAPAMLLRHAFGTNAGAFAQAGELVHIHDVIHDGDLVTITFYRDNGIDGPDDSYLLSVKGSWTDIGETLETLLEPGTLDDLLETEASLETVFGRYAAWNGQAFPIVPMLETLAIRVSLPCGSCGRNPTTAYARSGLHRGAFCYMYDALGTYLANLRDQGYICSRCEKARSNDGMSAVEDAEEDAH